MPAAIDWMEHVLGFERGAVPEEGGVVVHAQLAFGEDVIMVGRPPTRPRAARWRCHPVAADVDARYQRTRQAGGTITIEITDQDHGSPEFSVQDPEANTWSVGTYQPADPTERRFAYDPGRMSTSSALL